MQCRTFHTGLPNIEVEVQDCARERSPDSLRASNKVALVMPRISVSCGNSCELNKSAPYMPRNDPDSSLPFRAVKLRPFPADNS